MKIDQLAAAFRKLAALEPPAERPASTDPTAPANVAPDHRAPNRAETEPDATPTDTISLSSESVFRFAAANFDPRRLTDGQRHDLATLLHDGGAISARDRDILAAGSFRRHEPPVGGPNAASGTTYDGIARFQERLARAIGRSDIVGVEANGRAVAILGRIESLRSAGI